MNQMIEKFVNVSQFGSCYEDLVNFVSCIDSKYGTAIMAATPYVILGSIFMWMYVKRWRRSNSRRASSRSMSLAELHGGDLAMQRLIAHKEASVKPATLTRAPEILLDALLQQEQLDFMYMQDPVAKLEMSGREEAAIGILEKAKKAHANKPHEAYEIEMLIVEMLIYEGEFAKARACECLNDKCIADARRPLYKAVICLILEPQKEEQAKNCWEEYMDIKNQFRERKTPAHDINDFEEFKDKVLKDAIFARKKKAKN